MQGYVIPWLSYYSNIVLDDRRYKRRAKYFLTVDKREKKTFQLTGLSGWGKTTLALEVGKLLREQGYASQVLDGDEMHGSICAVCRGIAAKLSRS